jgi:hypothetical protein
MSGVSLESLRDMIRATDKWNDGPLPVELDACHMAGTDYPQLLADLLGVRVYATDVYFWLYEDGEYVLAPDRGDSRPDLNHTREWICFSPRNSHFFIVE